MSPSALTSLRESAPVILPSLLLCDFGNLEREVRALEEAGVRALHLDVMDGQFVPNLTYGMPVVEALRKLTDLPLDVHLMIDSPHRYLEAFRSAGADVLTVHVEAVDDARATLEAIRATGAAAGLAINPGTPFEQIEPYAGDCDLALVMSVPAGFGGQSFDEAAVERLRSLRKAHPDLTLEVDGGVNLETIGVCAEAGAELFVVGSGIFRRPSYIDAVDALASAANSR